MIDTHRRLMDEMRKQQVLKQRLQLRRALNDGSMVLMSKSSLEAFVNAASDPSMVHGAAPTSRH